MKNISFPTDETFIANSMAAATALRSLTQEYQKLNRVLVKTEKQLWSSTKSTARLTDAETALLKDWA